jgi:hypothetical protein
LNKEQVKSAKLVKVTQKFDDGRTYEKNGVHVQWETPLVISMARDINNHPNHTDKDVVNVVVTEMIQTEFSETPEYIAYTTVGDEPQVFTVNANSYRFTEFEEEALCRAGATDQIESLRLTYLGLERTRLAREQHEEKVQQAKASAKLPEHDAYRLGNAQRKLDYINKSLAKPVSAETTPTELIERAKQLLMKQLLELVVNNVGKLNCERKFASKDYDLDKYAMVTIKDVVLFIATEWKSSWSSSENLLDETVKKEVIESLRW